MALPKIRIVAGLDAEAKIVSLAEKLMREAGTFGIFPTPLEQLFDVARVKNIAGLPDETFIQSLPEKGKAALKSAMQKIRGIADLRERAVYIPSDVAPRQRFASGHELGHQVCDWHNVDPVYLDNSETLSPKTKNLFEREANFFSSEVIFQGRRFQQQARDYRASFDAIFSLADKHGASKQATAWRFTEVQDEAVALLQYYQGGALDENGSPVLNSWCPVFSPAFRKKYGEADIPGQLRTGHPWVAARDFNRVCDGSDPIPVAGSNVIFEWHSWWNHRALLVLLRRKPLLSIVGKILQ